MRTSIAAVGLVAVVGLLSGCNVHVATAPGSLPTLTGLARIRDVAARTDAAAASRAEELSAKATACEQCRSALDSLAADSTTRLTALGGLWDPWNGETPEGAESPAPVADAPVDPSTLAAWLAASATRDLEAVASDRDISGDEARGIAAVATGRLASAEKLAAAYGVTIEDGSDQVNAAIERMRVALTGASRAMSFGAEAGAQSSPESSSSASVTSANAGQNAGWNLDGGAASTPSPSPLPSDSDDVSSSEQLSEAVRTWDCAAQTLPSLQVVDNAIQDASTRSDVLLTRATSVLAVGVADTREQRCRLNAIDAAGVDTDILGADLDLFTSDSTAVRAIGVQMISEDVQTWLDLGDSGLSAVPATN